jgi:hypothetical protein
MLTYQGRVPDRCQICNREIKGVFVDGSTNSGPWGLMDPACHKTYGMGFGIGKGQEYTKQENGQWLKTKG